MIVVVDGTPQERALHWTEDTFAERGATLDADLVMPGFVCAHAELGAAFVPGFPKDGRLVLDAMDEDALYAAALLTAMNAALAGVTTIFDLWSGALVDGSLDVIARAVRDVGLRAVLACSVSDARKGAIRENVHFAREKTSDVFSRGAMGIGDPEGADAVLVEAAAEARKAEMPAHVVLRGSAAARRRIAERGALRSGSIAVLAPGVEIDDEERALLRDLRTWVALRPREGTTSDLRGIRDRVVLGGISPLEERAAMPRVAREIAPADASPAERAMRVARGPAAHDDSLAALTSHGQALASETFDRPFGRFGEGSPVDLVFLDAPVPAPVTRESLATHLDRLDSRHVRHVVVAGETIVRDRKPTRVDPEEVRAKSKEHLARIWAKAVRR